jgi:tetratricopeptide (TPR) repeat protein
MPPHCTAQNAHQGRARSAAALLIFFVLIFNACSFVRAQSSDLAEIAVLIRQGKLETADRRLQSILAKNSDSAKARTLLGLVYLRETRYADSEIALRKALQLDPRDFEALRYLGDACFAEGKTDAARTSYLDALKINPQDAPTHLALANLYLHLSQFDASLEASAKIPPASRTPELLPILAGDYIGLQQQEKASAEIQALLKVAGKNPTLVPQLAELLLEHGAFRTAEELLAKAAPLQEQTDRFLLDLARAQDGAAHRGEAVRTLTQILERSPQSLDALIAAAHVAGEKSDWDQAIIFLVRAQRLDPARADILQSLASAQLYANRPADAFETAKKLQALNPDDISASYFSALALFGDAKWEEARPYAAKVLAARPDDREMNLTMAGINYNLHELGEARKLLEVCLKQNPDDPGALYYLGLVNNTEGDLDGAIKALVKSVAANPKNSNAQSALGGLCLQSANLPCAREALEQAVQLSPKESQTRYQLSLAYTRSGLAQKAREQFVIYEKLKAQEQYTPATATAPPITSQSKP